MKILKALIGEKEDCEHPPDRLVPYIYHARSKLIPGVSASSSLREMVLEELLCLDCGETVAVHEREQ